VNDKPETFGHRRRRLAVAVGVQAQEGVPVIEANMNTGADLAKVEYGRGQRHAVHARSAFDPLDPEQARDMDVSTSGKFGGSAS